MNIQTCLPSLKPDGTLKSLSLEYAPVPSLPSLQMAPQPAREKAQCLNSAFASKLFASLPLVSVPTLSSHTQLLLDRVSFALDKMEGFLESLDSDSATGPVSCDRNQLTCPKNLLCCSCTFSFCSVHPIICLGSSYICCEISQHHCIT